TGKRVEMSAGKNISVRGSAVVSDEDTYMQAAENISLTAAQNHYTDNEFHQTKKSGLTGSLSKGVASIGYQKSREQDRSNSDETTLTLSRIGSQNGNTTIIAGKRLDAEAA
ncbi:hemagglutinin repeat-containing protein, partial [Conchiformibius steedae]